MTAPIYQDEMKGELQSILQYWMLYTPDEGQGGFLGRIDEKDRPDRDAPKGLVLNSRILWSFSAAWRTTGQWIYLPIATRAYEYLVGHFQDTLDGGFFWSLTPGGEPLNTRKQIYGQAFTLYGFSEYYRATGDQAVLDRAVALYRLIEKHGYDPVFSGYWEAFSRDWQPMADLRLSEKDANEQKTTNTHLHVLEAYTALYTVWPDAGLRAGIRGLLNTFFRHLVDPDTAHLRLFFTADWQPRGTLVSYGHDIEAAWLLHEAALAIGDPDEMARTARGCLAIAKAAEEGVDADGGLWYEKEDGRLISEKHWWPQAEAMVGFLRAWSISNDDHWWRRSIGAWAFVKRYIRQTPDREWIWGVQAGHEPMPGQDKAGFWKCPYHNSRACMEVIRLLSAKNPVGLV